MMTDEELKKELESEMRCEIEQNFRVQNSENNNVCTNCMHTEFKLSNYSSAHKICSIGGFMIDERMTCDHFEKIEIVKNAEQK